MSNIEYHEVASRADIPQGKTLRVDAQGQEVLLCHTSEGVFAVDNMCTHAAERLCGGRLKGQRIFCPLHGAAFDVRDGSVLSKPAKVALKTYPVKIEGDTILLGIGDGQ